MVFFAEFAGPGITEANSFGFWKWRPDGSLSRLLGQGVPAPLLPCRPGRKSTNMRGDVAVRLDFDDGNQAIAVLVVPEPATRPDLALGSCLGIALGRRRSRNRA